MPLTGRFRIPEKDIDKGRSTSLAREVTLHNRGRAVYPRNGNRGAIGQHHDGVGIGRRYRLDQSVVLQRQSEVRPVETFGFV